MPISRERRGELIAEYVEWFKQSQAVVIAGYQGVSTKDLYRLRSKIHEIEGELHVVKNTLAIKALQQAGLPVPKDLLTGSVIMSFGFTDPAAVAKACTDFRWRGADLYGEGRSAGQPCDRCGRREGASRSAAASGVAGRPRGDNPRPDVAVGQRAQCAHARTGAGVEGAIGTGRGRRVSLFKTDASPSQLIKIQLLS